MIDLNFTVLIQIAAFLILWFFLHKLLFVPLLGLLEERERTVRHSVRVDLYRIVCDAVERGVAYGLNRAHKHVDAPTRAHLEEHVSSAVLSELCDVIRFDDEDPA